MSQIKWNLRSLVLLPNCVKFGGKCKLKQQNTFVFVALLHETTTSLCVYAVCTIRAKVRATI